MVDSHVRWIASCEDDDDQRLAVVGVGNVLHVVGKIPWHQTTQASVNEHSQLELDVFRRLQPVKISQHR